MKSLCCALALLFPFDAGSQTLPTEILRLLEVRPGLTIRDTRIPQSIQPLGDIHARIFGREYSLGGATLHTLDGDGRQLGSLVTGSGTVGYFPNPYASTAGEGFIVRTAPTGCRVIRIAATGSVVYDRVVQLDMVTTNCGSVFPLADGSIAFASSWTQLHVVDPTGMSASPVLLPPLPELSLPERLRTNGTDFLRIERLVGGGPSRHWIGSWDRNGASRWQRVFQGYQELDVAADGSQWAVLLLRSAPTNADLEVQFATLGPDGTLLTPPSTAVALPGESSDDPQLMASAGRYVADISTRSTVVRWSDGSTLALPRSAIALSTGDRLWRSQRQRCDGTTDCPLALQWVDRGGEILREVALPDAQSITAVAQIAQDRVMAVGTDRNPDPTQPARAYAAVVDAAGLRKETDLVTESVGLALTARTIDDQIYAVLHNGGSEASLIRVDGRGRRRFDVPVSEGSSLIAAAASGAWLRAYHFAAPDTAQWVSAAGARGPEVHLPAGVSGSAVHGAIAADGSLWLVSSSLQGATMYYWHMHIAASGTVLSSRSFESSRVSGFVRTVGREGEYIVISNGLVERFGADGALRHSVALPGIYNPSLGPAESVLVRQAQSWQRVDRHGTVLWHVPMPTNSPSANACGVWDDAVEADARILVAFGCDPNVPVTHLEIQRWNMADGQLLQHVVLPWDSDAYGTPYPVQNNIVGVDARVRVDRTGQLALLVRRAEADGVLRFAADQPQAVQQQPATATSDLREAWFNCDGDLRTLGTQSIPLQPRRVVTAGLGLLDDGFEPDLQ